MHVVFLGPTFAAEFAAARRDAWVTVLHAKPITPPPGTELVVVGSARSEWLEAISELDRDRPVDRLVAFGEGEQLVAAHGVELLNLPDAHTHTVARLVADKYAMRQRLADAGLGAVSFHEVSNVAALCALVDGAEDTTSWVVKPVMGTGSRGVSRVRTRDQCEQAFHRALEVSVPYGGRAGVLAERFMEGRQFSVEAVSDRGRHHLVALTQKFTDRRTLAEVGHCVPAQVSDEEWDAIDASVRASLDALGVEWGPTHTEIVLQTSGVVHLIETHTRLGGHGIPSLVRDAMGLDLRSMVFDQIMEVTWGPPFSGGLWASDARSTHRAAAVWFGYVRAAGTLLSVEAPVTGDAEVEVLIERGAWIPGDMGRTSRVVAARASGSTAHEAVTRARTVVESTHVGLGVGMASDLLGEP